MGRESLRIVLSVAGAAAVAMSAFLLFEALLPGRGVSGNGVLLFRFQMGAMLAMALFAGLAIVIYARLSRWTLSAQRREREEKNRRNRK